MATVAAMAKVASESDRMWTGAGNGQCLLCVEIIAAVHSLATTTAVLF